MRKNILTIAIIILLISIIIVGCVWVYYNIQENKRIDEEAVKISNNLTIEFGKKVKVSDFIENLNGTLLNNYDIETEQLGDKQISFEFLNIKNKKRERTFNITIVDKEAPKIFSGNSYTVKVGYDKKLTDVLLSGDNIDDHPIREIIGEYDVNVVGDYNLTYVVTDASGNKTSKEFILHVIEDKKNITNESKDNVKENVYFEDVIKNYKKENTKIGIDVSKWQNKINWEEVKNAGAEFAIIRVRNSNRL